MYTAKFESPLTSEKSGLPVKCSAWKNHTHNEVRKAGCDQIMNNVKSLENRLGLEVEVKAVI